MWCRNVCGERARGLCGIIGWQCIDVKTLAFSSGVEKGAQIDYSYSMFLEDKKKLIIIVLLLGIVLSVPSLTRAGIYRYIDEAGRITDPHRFANPALTSFHEESPPPSLESLTGEAYAPRDFTLPDSGPHDDATSTAEG